MLAPGDELLVGHMSSPSLAGWSVGVAEVTVPVSR